MKKVKVNRSGYVLEDFFKVEEAYLEFEQYKGGMSDEVRRLCFERGDSVAIMLYNQSTGKYIFTEQFRYPAYKKNPEDGWVIELVAGSLGDGEDPTEAIRRETLEETGYGLLRVTYLSGFYVSPGGTSERILLFTGEVGIESKVEEGGGLATEHEDIQLIEFSIAELQDLLITGKIKDAKTLIGLLMVIHGKV